MEGSGLKAVLMLVLICMAASASVPATFAVESGSDGLCPTAGIQPSLDYDCGEQYGGILLPGEYQGKPVEVVYACVPDSSSDKDGVCLRDMGIS